MTTTPKVGYQIIEQPSQFINEWEGDYYYAITAFIKKLINLSEERLSPQYILNLEYTESDLVIIGPVNLDHIHVIELDLLPPDVYELYGYRIYRTNPNGNSLITNFRYYGFLEPETKILIDDNTGPYTPSASITLFN
jgi:hypothetical protein